MKNPPTPLYAPASAKASTSPKATADKSPDKPRRRKANSKTIEILPPLPDADDWTCTPDDITLPPELEFEPVTLRGGANAATPMKQRVFIRVLAETGRVTLAAKAAGKLVGSFYHLRYHEQGASFAAAWARALDFGTGRVLDLLLDHALNGTPEYIYKDGDLVAERRRFNHSLMMWLVGHNMPEKFAINGALSSSFNSQSGPMKKLKAKWEAEWKAQYEADLAASSLARAEEEAIAREVERSEVLPDMLVGLYQKKIREERRYRLNGQTLFADHALRSLVHLELYMEFAGLVEPEILAFFDNAATDPCAWETETSRAIERHRQEAWAMDEGEGILRPPTVHHGDSDGLLRCGPTYSERSKARQQAERQMAEAQRLWEACATEESWAVARDAA